MRKFLIAATTVMIPLAAPAYSEAGLFVQGSTFQLMLTNSPDTGSFTASLVPGTQTIDNGKILLTVTDIPTTGGGDWLDFKLNTANGLPFNNGTVNWSMSENMLLANQGVKFDGGFNGASVGGAQQTFSSSIFGNFTPGNGPLFGVSFGPGLYSNASFGSSPFPAGPLPNLFSFIDPFNALACCGVNAANVTGWEQAWHFDPQNLVGVPEPAGVAVLTLGLLGLGWLRGRRS